MALARIYTDTPAEAAPLVESLRAEGYKVETVPVGTVCRKAADMEIVLDLSGQPAEAPQSAPPAITNQRGSDLSSDLSALRLNREERQWPLDGNNVAAASEPLPNPAPVQRDVSGFDLMSELSFAEQSRLNADARNPKRQIFENAGIAPTVYDGPKYQPQTAPPETGKKMGEALGDFMSGLDEAGHTAAETMRAAFHKAGMAFAGLSAAGRASRENVSKTLEAARQRRAEARARREAARMEAIHQKNVVKWLSSEKIPPAPSPQDASPALVAPLSVASSRNQAEMEAPEGLARAHQEFAPPVMAEIAPAAPVISNQDSVEAEMAPAMPRRRIEPPATRPRPYPESVFASGVFTSKDATKDFARKPAVVERPTETAAYRRQRQWNTAFAAAAGAAAAVILMLTVLSTSGGKSNPPAINSQTASAANTATSNHGVTIAPRRPVTLTSGPNGGVTLSSDAPAAPAPRTVASRPASAKPSPRRRSNYAATASSDGGDEVIVRHFPQHPQHVGTVARQQPEPRRISDLN